MKKKKGPVFLTHSAYISIWYILILPYVVAPVIKAQALTEAIQIAGYAIGSTVFLIYIIFFVAVVIHYGCQEVNRRRNRYDIISLLLVNYLII